MASWMPLWLRHWVPVWTTLLYFRAASTIFRPSETVSESGFPGFEARAWWGVFAPTGTPKPIVKRFAAELAACLREPQVTKQLTETQQVSLALSDGEALREFLREQMRVWGAVAREHSITAD